MFDELDAECPDCRADAAAGDCSCEGGDDVASPLELEHPHAGRERTARRKRGR